MTHCWKNTVINQNVSIKNALRIIDQEALRVALVVDDEQNLLGVVTDGDVRRGLLNDITLDAPVFKVMNTEPYTQTSDVSNDKLLEIMEKLDVLFIPIVKEGKLVDLKTFHDLLIKPKLDNPVFIMAGGFGTRLRPLTDNCPKPMLKVGGKPMLETLINQFKSSGFHDFYLSTHYLPEVIKDYFGDGSKFDINIQYVFEDKPLGTGGALGLLPKTMPDLPVLVTNGDVLTNINFSRVLDFHNKSNADATMCVREYEYQIPYGVVEREGSSVIAMKEKPIQSFYVNAGIYVIGSEVIKSIRHNQHLDMPNLLERQIGKNKDVVAYPIHDYWLDIGRMEDFNKAQLDIHTLGILK